MLGVVKKIMVYKLMILGLILFLSSMNSFAQTLERSAKLSPVSDKGEVTALDAPVKVTPNLTDRKSNAIQGALPESNNSIGSNIVTAGRSPLPSLVHEAYHNAAIILGANNSCSRFFGGTQSVEALDSLVERLHMVTSFSALGIRMSGASTVTRNAKTGLTYRTFAKAEINQKGAFFKTKLFPEEPTVPAIGSFRSATNEARVLMLLHELGHMILGSDGHWLLRDDGDNAQLSASNTAVIENVCGREIRRIKTNR